MTSVTAAVTRPAVPVCLGLVSGMAAAYFLFADGSAGLGGLAVFAAFCALSSAILRLFHASFSPRAALFLLAAAAGCAYSYAYTSLRLRPLEALSGSAVAVEGEVYRRDAADAGTVYIYGKIGGIPGGIAVYAANFPAEVGDRVELSASVYSVGGSPLFDEKAYYYPDGVFLRAYAGEIEKITPGGGLFRAIRRYSERVSEEIRTVLPGDAGELICASVTGDRSAMSDRLSLSLNRAGAGHIAAVSGLHVSVAALSVWWILRRLRAPWAFAPIAAALAAAVFVIFSGIRVSAVRAAVMTVIFAASELFFRRRDSLNTLSVCAALICLFSPYSPADASFQLSFAGAFAVAVASPAVIKSFGAKSRLAKALVTSFCASLCTAPFALLHFNEISLAAPLINLIAVPLCTVSIVLGMIFALSGCAFPAILRAAGVFTAPVTALCGAVSKIRAAYLPIPDRVYAAAAFSLAVAVFGIYLLKRKPSAAFKAALFLAALFIFAGGLAAYLGSGETRLTVLNSGRQRALLARRAGDFVMIDVGGGSSETFEELAEKYGLTGGTVVLLGGGTASEAAYRALPCAPESFYSVEPGETREFAAPWVDIAISGEKIVINAGNGELLVNFDSYSEPPAGGSVVTLLDGVTVVDGRAYGGGLIERKIGQNGALAGGSGLAGG